MVAISGSGGGFLRDENGAVTVDWVVLTAAVVFLGVVGGFAIGSSVPSLAGKLGDFLESRPVGPDE